jgi:hypothetical protein
LIKGFAGGSDDEDSGNIGVAFIPSSLSEWNLTLPVEVSK